MNGLRNALLKLHLWAGLVTGIPLAIAGVSGSFLVFGGEIERLLNSQLNYVTPAEARLSLDGIVEAARRTTSDPIVALGIPPGAENAYVVMVRTRRYIYVDPYTGAVLGSKSIEATVQRKAFLIHTSLMAGRAGNWLVIGSTALTAFIVSTGIVLWWRRKILSVRFGAPWRRVTFDLHNVLGFYAFPIVLVLALTGLIIAFEETALFARFSKAPSPESPPQSAPVGDAQRAPRLTYDQAAELGARALPGARVTFIAMPPGPTGPVSVYAKFPEDPGEPGKSRIFLDQHTGKVLRVKSTRGVSATVRFLDLVEPIHFGDVFGLPSMIVVFVVGLFLTGQVVAGALIWWNSRKASLARRARPRSAG